VESIGLNIDLDDQQIVLPDEHFPKDIPYYDFKYYYTLRFYRYYDKFTDQAINRIDVHSDTITQYNLHGILDSLMSLGKNGINPFIELRKKQTLDIQTFSKMQEVQKEVSHIGGSVQSESQAMARNLTIVNKNVNDNAVALNQNILQIKHDSSREITSLQDQMQQQLTQTQTDLEKKQDQISSDLKTLQSNTTIIQNNLNGLENQVDQLKKDAHSANTEVKEHITAKITDFSKEYYADMEDFDAKLEGVNLSMQNSNQTLLTQMDQKFSTISREIQDSSQKTNETIEILKDNSTITADAIQQLTKNQQTLTQSQTDFQQQFLQNQTQQNQALSQLTQIVSELNQAKEEQAKSFLTKWKEKRQKKV
jgi:outer membrane murein-binding lipoprotein Lpp